MEKALSELNKKFSNGLWNNSIIETGYSLLNMGRLNNKLLNKFNFINKIELSKNVLLQFLMNFEKEKVDDSELPVEIRHISNSKEIYILTISMRGLISSESNRKEFIPDFAHAHLKYVYEKMYDPLVKECKKLKIQNQYIIPLLFMVSFLGIAIGYIIKGQSFYDTFYLIGAIASITGFFVAIFKRRINK